MSSGVLRTLVPVYFILATISLICEYFFLRWIASALLARIASRVLFTQSILALLIYYIDWQHSRARNDVQNGDTNGLLDIHNTHANTNGDENTGRNGRKAEEHPENEPPLLNTNGTSELRRRKPIDHKPANRHDPHSQQQQESKASMIAPQRRPLMYLMLYLSLFLYIFCLDATFRPYVLNTGLNVTYARVGAVSSNSANIFIRSPTNESVTLYSKSIKDSNDWKLVTTATPPLQDDYTISATISHLQPQSRYEYSWKRMHEPDSVLESRKAYFRTFPSNKSRGIWTFAFASCVRPNFPYGTKGIQAFRHMADRKNLSFLVFLGDLIYADSPYFICPEVDCYRRKYRELANEDDYQYFVKDYPSFYIYDDHEVFNNWKSNTTAPYPAAMKAYMEYAGNTNPGVSSAKTYYDFEYGRDAAFFISDTRRYRNEVTKTMLGPEQMQDLKDWLIRVNQTHMFKFIVSSVPLQRNWVIDKQDTWAGFPEARQELLDFIYTNNVQKVIFLTGDRHEVGVSKLHPYGIIDVSVGPLNQFYSPFHTYRAKQDGDESIFEWRVGNTKWCEVVVDGENGLVEFRLWVLDFSSVSPVWTWKYDGQYFTL